MQLFNAYKINDFLNLFVIQCPDTEQLSLPATGVQRPRDDFVNLSTSSAGDCDLSETALVRLHRRVIVSVEQYNSTQCQWNKLIENAVYLKDVGLNQTSGTCIFVRSMEVERRSIWSCCRCPRFGQLRNYVSVFQYQCGNSYRINQINQICYGASPSELWSA